MAFSVYSLADVIVTFNHPDVGKLVVSDKGGGRITISHGGDLASNTTTATGYVVVNKLVAKNGSASVEVPTNSEADIFFRKWIAYIKQAATSKFALGSMVLKDTAANRTITMTGVVPQKEPDEGYDAQAANRQYNMLFADMTVK